MRLCLIAIAATMALGATASFGAAGQAPTGNAALAVSTVQQYDPAQLSFADREFVLSYRDASPANKAAAQKVWAAILALQAHGKKLKIPATVIAATVNSLDVAITDDNVQNKIADMHISLKHPTQTPLPADKQVYVVGRLATYKLKPLRFIMKQAEFTER